MPNRAGDLTPLIDLTLDRGTGPFRVTSVNVVENLV